MLLSESLCLLLYYEHKWGNSYTNINALPFYQMKLLYTSNGQGSHFLGSKVSKPTAILGFSIGSVEKYNTL